MDNDVEMQTTSEELNSPNTQILLRFTWPSYGALKKSLIQITPLTKCTPLQTVAKAKHSQLLMDDEMFIKEINEMLPDLEEIDCLTNEEVTRTENNAEDSHPWSFMKVAVFIMLSVLRIHSHSRWVFLGLGVAFLKYQGDKLITQFDLKLGNISGEELLNLGKAFDEFIPEIIDETTIMVCYPLVLLLIYPLGPFYKIIFMLKLIFGLLYYIPPLVAKASVVEVNCGFLNLPLFWFITFLAHVLSLVIHFLVLLLIYLDYRFIRVQRDQELNLRMPCKIFPCTAM